MEYGPEIKRGSDAWPETDVRPVWLDTDEGLSLRGDYSKHWYDDARIGKGHDIMWEQADAIRLPADHWAYKAIEAGFTPCNGKSDDWDGGEVLGANGRLYNQSGGAFIIWNHDSKCVETAIIGYHRKQTVTIEMRTEDGWTGWMMGKFAPGSVINPRDILNALGLVSPPPTPLERFMAEHPDADRRTAELVLGWKG